MCLFFVFGESFPCFNGGQADSRQFLGSTSKKRTCSSFDGEPLAQPQVEPLPWPHPALRAAPCAGYRPCSNLMVLGSWSRCPLLPSPYDFPRVFLVESVGTIFSMPMFRGFSLLLACWVRDPRMESTRQTAPIRVLPNESPGWACSGLVWLKPILK